MRPGECLRVADKMGVDRKWALGCRKRYLAGQLFDAEMDSVYWLDRIDDGGDVAWMAVEYAIKHIKANGKLRKDIARYDTAMIKASDNDITDDMIATARAYPIDKLVELHHGKARAPCHDDRNPSMYHATRTNRLRCPVCDKSWDTIGWLMDIEGRTFRDAVRELQ